MYFIKFNFYFQNIEPGSRPLIHNRTNPPSPSPKSLVHHLLHRWHGLRPWNGRYRLRLLQVLQGEKWKKLPHLIIRDPFAGRSRVSRTLDKKKQIQSNRQKLKPSREARAEQIQALNLRTCSMTLCVFLENYPPPPLQNIPPFIVFCLLWAL